jgi:hypothetical protein
MAMLNSPGLVEARREALYFYLAGSLFCRELLLDSYKFYQNPGSSPPTPEEG